MKEWRAYRVLRPSGGGKCGLTPPWPRFSILTPGPIQMKQGALIDYRLRPRGIPIRWQSEITAGERGVATS